MEIGVFNQVEEDFGLQLEELETFLYNPAAAGGSLV